MNYDEINPRPSIECTECHASFNENLWIIIDEAGIRSRKELVEYLNSECPHNKTCHIGHINSGDFLASCSRCVDEMDDELTPTSEANIDLEREFMSNHN